MQVDPGFVESSAWPFFITLVAYELEGGDANQLLVTE